MAINTETGKRKLPCKFLGFPEMPGGKKWQQRPEFAEGWRWAKFEKNNCACGAMAPLHRHVPAFFAAGIRVRVPIEFMRKKMQERSA
ncbi:hypothetical protein [Ensifer sp.]|uniref:hypothetical protein n=1 Tax=Ensifer sp. TaxID=1872086 RepID=UPI00289D2B9D|nr:hypothetical protein [Ensifer sp.]